MLTARLGPIADSVGILLIRVVAGAFLVAHGWPKWQAGVRVFAASLARRGLEPALPLAWMVVGLEVIGGALIALGLLTRLVSFVAAGHLAFIAFYITWANGFAWTRGGWEYPAMWAALLLYLALRGGGPLSLDRILFRR